MLGKKTTTTNYLKSQTFFFIVLLPKARSYIEPKRQFAYTGESVTIKCVSDRRPQWRREGKKFRYKEIQLYDGQQEVISLRRLTISDTGIYQCIPIYNKKRVVYESFLYVGSMYTFMF